MAIPNTNGVFIHEGLNCSPMVVPTAQSIPISTTDNTTTKNVIDTTLSNLAEEFSTSSTYAVGDCVLYQRVLYKCTTAITTAGAWDSTKWASVKAVSQASAGSSTTPCYFDNGTPTACTYSLNKSVPSDAVFTDKQVYQVANEYGSSSSYYSLLYSYVVGGNTVTTYAKKHERLAYDPYSGYLRIKNNYNRLELGSDIKLFSRGYISESSTTSQLQLSAEQSGYYDYGQIVIRNNNEEVISLNGFSAAITTRNFYAKNSSGTITVGIEGSSGNIYATSLNGVTIGSSPKFTDTIPVQVYAQANRNFTSSTTLSYTGLSTSCPAGKRMLVRAYFRYVNNAPLQVGAYTSSTGASAYSCMGYGDVNTGTFTLNFVITGGETIYYWAKYNGAGANRIDEEKVLLG